MQYLLLLIPPFAVAVWSFMTKRDITAKEFVLQLIACAIVATGGYFGAKHFTLQDTEYWNGRIISKEDGRESCCHCTTVCDSTDKDGNCTSSHEECDHILDYWWELDLSTGDSIHDGCNGSAYDEPTWWTRADVGMPAVYPHSYQNYLKADPQSLMTPTAKRFLDRVPEFPAPPDDCPYCIKRVLTLRGLFPSKWQNEMEELNADLGKRRQVDVYLLPTHVQDREFAEAVAAKWLYGPKNAVTVVFGVKDDKVTWSDIVSMSDVPELRVKLRNDLLGKSIYDEDFIDLIRRHIDEEFKRTPMATYNYLSSSVRLSTGMLMLLLTINIIISIVLSFWMEQKDVFNEERHPRRRRPF